MYPVILHLAHNNQFAKLFGTSFCLQWHPKVESEKMMRITSKMHDLPICRIRRFIQRHSFFSARLLRKKLKKMTWGKKLSPDAWKAAWWKCSCWVSFPFSFDTFQWPFLVLFQLMKDNTLFLFLYVLILSSMWTFHWKPKIDLND